MLTDDLIDNNWREANRHDDSWMPPIHQRFARAIESAACADRDKRIAELEAANEAFGKRQEWWNERMVELERQFEEVRKQALKEAVEAAHGIKD